MFQFSTQKCAPLKHIASVTLHVIILTIFQTLPIDPSELAKLIGSPLSDDDSSSPLPVPAVVPPGGQSSTSEPEVPGNVQSGILPYEGVLPPEDIEAKMKELVHNINKVSFELFEDKRQRYTTMTRAERRDREKLKDDLEMQLMELNKDNKLNKYQAESQPEPQAARQKQRKLKFGGRSANQITGGGTGEPLLPRSVGTGPEDEIEMMQRQVLRREMERIRRDKLLLRSGFVPRTGYPGLRYRPFGRYPVNPYISYRRDISYGIPVRGIRRSPRGSFFISDPRLSSTGSRGGGSMEGSTSSGVVPSSGVIPTGSGIGGTTGTDEILVPGRERMSSMTGNSGFGSGSRFSASSRTSGLIRPASSRTSGLIRPMYERYSVPPRYPGVYRYPASYPAVRNGRVLRRRISILI